MSPLVLEKPVFTKDQVVSATEASKSLSAIRKRAKRAPQFIADHNDIEFVPFEDALTTEELAEFESMDPDAIPDEDLFE